MIDYTLILTKRYAGKSWTLNGDDYEGLTWLSDTPKPTKEELDALWESTQAEVAADAQAIIDIKASALSKLTAIGLTEKEIKTLLGTT
jgi:hypothetical protein